MCPICGKYRELTRCVRRMRIAHPTPPRGGGIPHACPTPEAAENFRPGPSARPPIGRSRSRPSRRRSRPRVRPSRRRERPDSAFPRRSPAVEGSQAFARRGAGRRPLVLARRRSFARGGFGRPAKAPRAREATGERRFRPPRTGRWRRTRAVARRQRLPSAARATSRSCTISIRNSIP